MSAGQYAMRTKKKNDNFLPGQVLIIDDDDRVAHHIALLVSKAVPCSAEGSSDPQAAIVVKPAHSYDLVVTDLRMPKRDGLAVLAEIKALVPRCEVIVSTAYPTLRSAIEAMKLGAIEYVKREGGDRWIDPLIEAIRLALRTRPSGRAPGYHREHLIQFFLNRIGIGEGGREELDGQLPPGLALEYAVKLLLESCEGFDTTWHRMRTQTEEHDLVCLNQAIHGFWAHQGPVILVECKDYGKTRPGANERGRFEQKIRNRQGQATVGIFASSSGFAKTFFNQPYQSPVPGGGPPVLVPLDAGDLSNWSEAYDRLGWLTERAIASVF